ncbi:N-acetyltransferase family protein [Streptomyces ziwulingensis]
MPAPHIRHARSDDEQPLRRLDRETWSSLHAVSPPPGPDDPFFREHAGPADHLVAELDGAVVGYLRLGFPTGLASNAHVRQIRGLAVAEAARGNGVGRALVRAAVDEARRLGARRLTLRVLGHNTAARGLYESEGFTVEGVHPEEFLLDGRYVDDVLMGRSFTTGGPTGGGPTT